MNRILFALRKPFRVGVALLAGVVAASCPAAGTGGTVFHVSPNGSDSWSGRRSAPNFFRTDGPFASLPRALQAARGSERKPVTINLQRGMFFLREAIVLGPEDSGLTIEGEGVLSAGFRVTGWTVTNLNEQRVYVASVPGRKFQQLWVNGRRATRARHPGAVYFSVAGVPDKTGRWQDGQSRFHFKEGEVHDWKEIDPLAKVVVMNRWVESHLPIDSIFPQDRLVSFRKRSVWQLAAGDPWYVEGVRELLDSPGEWFLDSNRGMLYYFPLKDEKVEELEAIAPVFEEVVRLAGEPVSGRFVERITFRGLTFSHTEWSYPAATPPGPDGKFEPGGAVQAAYTVPAAVRAVGAHQVLFERCRFERLGNYGLELGVGCRSNLIARCVFRDLAAGGIKVGSPGLPGRESEFAGENEIADCEISDGGRVFHSAVGIWIGQSPNNRIVHNDIYDFYYTGISIGWTWGYGGTTATNNYVAFNRVHHIGKRRDGDGPILSDMGGIYTLGMQPGTVILNNHWHDIHGLRYGGWGIYFDEGSSSILAASNVVTGTTHGGFHQHYGATNTVMNNIFALARDHQLQRTRPEDHISFHFKTNIVVIDQGAFLGGNWTGGAVESGNNVFFDTRPGGETNTTFEGRTFKAWRQSGREESSIYADPLFVTREAGGLELGESSPAFAIGFGQIDLRRVGPR